MGAVSVKEKTISRLAALAADVLALLALCAVFYVLLQKALYYPEINPDEAGAYLGLQLLQGKYGFPLDPESTGFTRYFFFDVYPPVYYFFNALIFKIFGFGIIQARAATILFMTGGGLLCYLAVRRHGGAGALLTLALFIHIVPSRVYALVVNRPDIATHFFVFGALLLLFEAAQKQRNPRQFRYSTVLAGVAGMSYALGVLSHFVGLMAGPVVAAALFYRTGWRFWRSPAFYVFCLGFFIPVAAYLAAMAPHFDATLNGLLAYGGGKLGRALKNHLDVLLAVFEEVIYGLIPLAVAVVAAFAVPSARSLLSGGVIYWAAACVGLFALLSLYPNIGLVWYYGLVYMYAGLAMTGLLAAKMLPRRGWWLVLVVLLAGGFVVDRTLAFDRKAQKQVAWAENVQVKTAMGWTENFKDVLSGPTLAPLTFIFSAAFDRILDPRVLRNRDGTFDFVRGLAEAVPELPKVSAYRTMILGHHRDYYDANTLLLSNKRGKEKTNSFSGPHGLRPEKVISSPTMYAVKAFTPTATIRDPGHGTGNFTIFQRTEDLKEVPMWPRMALVTPEGPVEHVVRRQCLVSIPVSKRLVQVGGDSRLWHLKFPLSFTEGLDTPVLARFILRSGSKTTEIPLGVVVYFPSPRDEREGHASIIGGKGYPFLSNSPRDAITYTGFRLPTGERGGDLMVLPPRPGARVGTVSLYTLMETSLERLDLVVLLPEKKDCDSQLSKATKEIASGIIASFR